MILKTTPLSALWTFPSILLSACYFVYLWILWKIPPRQSDEETLEDLGVVPRRVLKLNPGKRAVAIWLLFLAGGVILYLSAHPFLNSMLAIAGTLGISTFI